MIMIKYNTAFTKLFKNKDSLVYDVEVCSKFDFMKVVVFKIRERIKILEKIVINSCILGTKCSCFLVESIS